MGFSFEEAILPPKLLNKAKHNLGGQHPNYFLNLGTNTAKTSGEQGLETRFI